MLRLVLLPIVVLLVRLFAFLLGFSFVFAVLFGSAFCLGVVGK